MDDGCLAFTRPKVGAKDAPCCMVSSGKVTATGGNNGTCFVKEGVQKSLPGGSFVGDISMVPTVFSTQFELWSARYGGRIASSEQYWCLPWQHCDFVIRDCEGEVLYTITAKVLPDLDYPKVFVPAYELRNAKGTYIGRTSELQSGYAPIHLVDAEGKRWASLTTRWSRWSAIFTTEWFVNAEQFIDPRLELLFTANVGKHFGWLGPFWTLVLFLLFILWSCFAYRQYRKSREYYGAVDGSSMFMTSYEGDDGFKTNFMSG